MSLTKGRTKIARGARVDIATWSSRLGLGQMLQRIGKELSHPILLPTWD
jgi:hypothetical protein